MTPSFRTALTSFIALIACFNACLSQQVAIVGPAAGSTVTTGQKLNITLKVTSTTSSVQYIAFSTGFRTIKYKDDNSLGYPYVGTVFPEVDHNVTLDSAKLTYNYQIIVPQASNFSDPLPAKYNLTVANYFFLGATLTPRVQMTAVEVNVQKGNETSPSGGNTPSGSGNNPSTPTSGSTHLNRPLFAITASLASMAFSLIF